MRSRSLHPVRLWPLGTVIVLLLSACGPTPDEPADSRGEESGSEERLPLFTDVTDASGIEFDHHPGLSGEFWLPEAIGPGGALLDFDGDGDLDVFLVQGGDLRGPKSDHPNQLFRNDGGWRFVDVSESSGEIGGSDASGYAMGAAAADYDADGDLDLYVTRLGPNQLLRNDGDGTFGEIGAEVSVDDPGFGASATFFDYDRDGRLDLYIVNYVDWAPARESTCFDPRGLRDYCSPMVYESPARDRLYRGLVGGRFADVTRQAGVADFHGNGLGGVAVDFDDDGWVDLFVANDQTPGFLWVNQGDGSFLEDGALRGCAFNANGVTIAGMGVVSEDLDGDGDFDLLVTNIHGQPHLALRNDREVFTDQSHRWGLASWSVPYTGFGIALFDQDLDGDFEALVANGAVNRLSEPFDPGNDYAEPNQFVRRDRAGRFVDTSVAPGPGLTVAAMSRAVLTGDLDGDGDVDAVITNNRGRTQVLRNDNDSVHGWILVALRGANGAASPHNTRVTVTAGGRSRIRELQPAQGYLGSNDPRLSFGLAAATEIDRLDVRWPDGARHRFIGLPHSQVITILEGPDR